MATKSVARYFEGLLIGGVLGFAAGILTAPKAGADTRRELADAADDLLKQASEQWEDMRDNMSDRMQPIADRAVQYRDRVRDQASGLKDKIGDKADALRDRAESAVNKAKDKGQAFISKKQSTGENGKNLVDNFMGNYSGPVYTPGNKVSPTSAASSVSDACSTYEANQPEAAGS